MTGEVKKTSRHKGRLKLSLLVAFWRSRSRRWVGSCNIDLDSG
jgi:hypothetical protein